MHAKYRIDLDNIIVFLYEANYQLQYNEMVSS